MIEVDYIIVGQGIAGTLLAYRLEEAGKSVIVIDKGQKQTASKVSSGLMNPITGRRYVKSWMFEKLIEESVSFYKKLERKLNSKILIETEILRGLTNVLDENLWHGQSGKPDYEKYFGPTIQDSKVTDHFKNELSLGTVLHGYRVNMPRFMKLSQVYFENKDMLINDDFNYNELEIKDASVKYKRYKAKAIIFAQGWNVKGNPFFNNLPFDPNRGEILLVRIENYEIKAPVKNKKFIIPWEDDLYWVGSTIELGIKDEQSNSSKKQELIDYLNEYLNRPYEIVGHWIGVRPTTEQRHPILGCHQDHNNILIFNGLGTKGVSLSPYFSKMMTEYLIDKKEVIPEVDITRYYN